MKLSGWCSGPNGGCTSERAHQTCQTRQDRGLLTCDCRAWDGHERFADRPVVRDNGGKK